MHMTQHILLLDIAPILLILGLNKVLLRPATRRLHTIERKAGFLAHPAFAVFAYVGFMWLWHVPALYDAALRNSGLHAFEHICFALAGGLYWWHLLSPIRGRMRLGGMGPVMYMVSTKLLVGLLGIALAFAPTALYAFYKHQPHYWGLTAGEDMNMAGLLMALEQSIVMGIALAYLFVQMLVGVGPRGRPDRPVRARPETADRSPKTRPAPHPEGYGAGAQLRSAFAWLGDQHFELPLMRLNALVRSRSSSRCR